MCFVEGIHFIGDIHHCKVQLESRGFWMFGSRFGAEKDTSNMEYDYTHECYPCSLWFTNVGA